MSLKDMARTGRNAVWTRRGVDEFGGGFLGLFLMKLLQKSEERIAKKQQKEEARPDVFDRILNLLD